MTASQIHVKVKLLCARRRISHDRDERIVNDYGVGRWVLQPLMHRRTGRMCAQDACAHGTYEHTGRMCTRDICAHGTNGLQGLCMMHGEVITMASIMTDSSPPCPSDADCSPQCLLASCHETECRPYAQLTHVAVEVQEGTHLGQRARCLCAVYTLVATLAIAPARNSSHILICSGADPNA